MSPIKRIIHPLSSLRLAVFVIASLGIVAAVGTITEAHYNDAEAASKLVYQSVWMYAVLGLLCVNLIAVMISRWPWKQHHTGFIMAHVGIITLLFGAWITQHYGVDGNMVFEIGQSRSVIQVKDRDILVYGALPNGDMRPIFRGPADFLRHPISTDNPLEVNLGSDTMRFVEFHPFAFRESEIAPTEAAADGPAIRFQLENQFVNMTQWLRREPGSPNANLDLGPAKIVLSRVEPSASGHNEVILRPKENSPILDYVIFNKDRSLRKKGQVRQSETIDTGWMGLQVRLLRYLPHAAETVSFTPISYFTPMTTSAVKFLFKGKEYWVGLDAPLKIFTGDRAYVVIYAHRQISLGFPLLLKQFRMGKYEGTERASSYESEVDVPEKGPAVISMNEPLKYAGFTFYQSSFEQNERGEPTASILSVNYDPGRWLKYLGSLLIVSGSIILFYFKRVKWIKHGSPK